MSIERGDIIKSRQLEIIIYLMKHKKSTYEELSKYLEVSKKTIGRDIDKLSSMGIPIYTQNGYKGGVFIDDNYKFDKTFFTINEIEYILAISYILKCLNEKNYNNILKKLGMIFPEEVLLKEADLLEYFKIELLEKPLSLEESVFNTINKSLDLEKNLNLEYKGKRYIVSPLYYILKPKGLYIEVFYKNSKRSLFVENIKKCFLTDEQFDRENILKNFK